MNSNEETITWNDCKVTTLKSAVQTKLIATIVVKNTDIGELLNFTCFSDGIENFLETISCKTSVNEIE